MYSQLHCGIEVNLIFDSIKRQKRSRVFNQEKCKCEFETREKFYLGKIVHDEERKTFTKILLKSLTAEKKLKVRGE